MQYILIATTNTQKKTTPDLIIPLTSETVLKTNYMKSYTGIFQKHGKTIQIFHTLYIVLNVSRY